MKSTRLNVTVNVQYNKMRVAFMFNRHRVHSTVPMVHCARLLIVQWSHAVIKLTH